MTYQSQDEMIAAMKASAEETNRRMKFLDEQDMHVASEFGGHNVPTGVIAEIIAEAARAFGVTELQIVGQSVRRDIAAARAAVYYAAHQNGYTLSAIGRALHRDHTTVLSGIRRHEQRRAANA